MDPAVPDTAIPFFLRQRDAPPREARLFIAPSSGRSTCIRLGDASAAQT
jgi:hypothetical protein